MENKNTAMGNVLPTIEMLLSENIKLSDEEKIRKILADISVPIKNLKVTVGPTVSLYEIFFNETARFSRKDFEKRIREEIDGIVRIVSAQNGKYVIDVVNNIGRSVPVMDILGSKNFQETSHRLPIAFGITSGNEVYVADLTSMPHLIIAGGTKKECTNGFNLALTSLLLSKRPNEIKYVIIDSDKSRLNPFSKLPVHFTAQIEGMKGAVVSDHSEIPGIIRCSLFNDMKSRFKIFLEAGARNISEYNERVKSEYKEGESQTVKMPYIVVAINNYDRIIGYLGYIDDAYISFIARMSRTVGIHFILSTSIVDHIITQEVKANFPARLAFRTENWNDKQIILDTWGTQCFSGEGDLLIKNHAPLVRVQLPYIEPSMIESLCSYLSQSNSESGTYILPE